jgi:hypothetical protein
VPFQKKYGESMLLTGGGTRSRRQLQMGRALFNAIEYFLVATVATDSVTGQHRNIADAKRGIAERQNQCKCSESFVLLLADPIARHYESLRPRPT